MFGCVREFACLGEGESWHVCVRESVCIFGCEREFACLGDVLHCMV